MRGAADGNRRRDRDRDRDGRKKDHRRDWLVVTADASHTGFYANENELSSVVSSQTIFHRFLAFTNIVNWRFAQSNTDAIWVIIQLRGTLAGDI